MSHRPGEVEVADLLVLEDLLDVQDGSRGDALGVEALDPRGARLPRQDLLDLGVEGAAVAGAVGEGGKAGVIGEGLDAESAAEPAEHRLPGRRDVDVPVPGLEDPGGNERGVVVAGLRRNLAADEPARGLEVEHGHHGLEQGGVHPLAAPRALAFEQGHEHALGEIEPRGQVCDGNAHPHGALSGDSGDGHQPAHPLSDLVVAGAIAIGAVLAESGNRGIDQPRVHGAQSLVVDAQTELDVGAEVLHHHVGPRDQALENLAAPGGLEIEGHRALVAMQVLEIEPVARRIAVDIGAGFDLDDPGAHVCELPYAGGAGACSGEIDDGVGGEWECIHRGLDDTPTGMLGPGAYSPGFRSNSTRPGPWAPATGPAVERRSASTPPPWTSAPRADSSRRLARSRVAVSGTCADSRRRSTIASDFSGTG